MTVRKTLLVSLILLYLIIPLPLKGEEDFYYVQDDKTSLSEEFTSYYEAYDYYEEHLDEYDNLLLLKNENVLQMEYGIVSFEKDEACRLVTEYYSVSKDTKDYLNGCYGADGAYLYSENSSQRVYFMIGEDIGYASIDEVRLIPYERLNTRLSVYSCENGILSHHVMSQLQYDFYSYTYELDDGVKLKDGNYFSYDGHYFYDDFREMIDDYRNESREHAANEEVYYNYYQYLPFRSFSAYDYEEVEQYFTDVLCFDGRLLHYTDFNNDAATDEVNRSQLYGEIPAFFVYQSIYGTNAMMLLSSAIEESSYGKSYGAFAGNNLYQTSAFESDEERDNNRYSTVERSIYAHAKYLLSSRYGNHRRSDYSGTFYGNKVSGINVNYSPDPYFGEKSASRYHELDQSLSAKDKNAQALGIIAKRNRVNFYYDEELDRRRFSLNYVNELSYVILKECEDSYMIQIDDALEDDYRYDFNESIAYVDKGVFDFILNEEKIHDHDLKEVTYDFAGGTFNGNDELTILQKDEKPLPIRPEKEGFEFNGYDENHQALYRKIAQVRLTEEMEKEFELYQDPDLSKGKLQVQYEEDKDRTVELNTDMISAYDKDSEGKQTLIIDYCGMLIEQEISFSSDMAALRQEISQAITAGDYHFIDRNIARIRYPFTFSEIRQIDYTLRQEKKRNYVIDDKTEKYNLSISGLDLSLPDKLALSFIGDTYYVIVDQIKQDDAERIYETGKAYGFEQVDGIDIRFRFNYQQIALKSQAIVQLDIENKRNDLIYSVYHLNDNNDVIKCRTTQSENYIQFLIDEEGSYLVMSMKSPNQYRIQDNTEDLSYENMGYDKHRMNFELMSIIVMALSGIALITLYYIVVNKRKNMWKDFRRSLRTADFVQEEKPKN